MAPVTSLRDVDESLREALFLLEGLARLGLDPERAKVAVVKVENPDGALLHERVTAEVPCVVVLVSGGPTLAVGPAPGGGDAEEFRKRWAEAHEALRRTPGPEAARLWGWSRAAYKLPVVEKMLRARGVLRIA